MRLSSPFQASVWLIIAYLIHLCEEWFWGFPEWSRVIRGEGVSSDTFIAINSIGLLLFVTLAALTRRRPEMAWFPAILATIFSLNGVLHALATWRYGVYSPGTVSGILISLPLGLLVLREMRKRLSVAAFTGCLVWGVIAHIFITFIAFR
ncbi:MAG: HXXEE domain-containing protein [Woeseiaceae bacterium]